MTPAPITADIARVDEPGAAEAYSAVLTQVAHERRPLIVQRDGEDLAAVVPLEHLELVREILAREEVQELAAEIDWERARQRLRPPPEWFDGEEPKPF